MLTETERREIEHEVQTLGHRRAACVEALKIVQAHRVWVDDEGLRDAAAAVGLTTAEMDNVATFYNGVFRRRIGRHAILVCESVSCFVCGCEKLFEHLKKRLAIDAGQTTADGRFTLVPICCLGCCDRGPAMVIGKDLHTDLTPEKVDLILERYS
ncbi:MAG: NADH-quinone oxidoreductase subunit NuoE [Candidatus Sumerlaeota bacterium]|nr:NADH-quinone oxidoreductase subunit NuoE [Candidatus Sumerlaeota bacterium]